MKGPGCSFLYLLAGIGSNRLHVSFRSRGKLNNQYINQSINRLINQSISQPSRDHKRSRQNISCLNSKIVRPETLKIHSIIRINQSKIFNIFFNKNQTYKRN